MCPIISKENSRARSNLSSDFRETLRYFFVVFLFTVLMIGGITVLIYYLESKGEELIVKTQEKEHLQLVKTVISNELKDIASDLTILAAHQEVTSVLENDNPVHKDRLVHEFLAFSESKKIYDQARFLDVNGMEIIRVNLDENQAYLVPENELQFKGNRYYFSETLRLNKGEIFISPFDLNVEEGKIELPLKPVIRMAMPVFDSKGLKGGIIIVNYLGKNLIDSLEKELTQRGKFLFINSEGYWLKGPRIENEWGFMYEDKSDLKFEKDYPEAWTRIVNTESGQFYTSEGLFTFTTIYPLEETKISDSKASRENTDYYWKLVDYVPASLLKVDSRRILFRTLLIDAFLVTIIGVGGWFFAQSVTRRRKAEKRVFELNKILKLLNKILRHDILNDLTVVEGNLEMHMETHREQNFKDSLIALDRSKGLIGQMRALESAVSAGKSLKPYQARKIIDEISKVYTSIKFNISGHGKVLADEAFSSVIDNIVRNAKTHGKTDRMDIRIEEKRNMVEIRIADYGIGIPGEIKDKLFVEGFKYGETGHTGLGLYIVKKTIERYGGNVFIEDNKPRGVVFVLQLQKVGKK